MHLKKTVRNLTTAWLDTGRMAVDRAKGTPLQDTALLSNEPPPTTTQYSQNFLHISENTWQKAEMATLLKHPTSSILTVKAPNQNHSIIKVENVSPPTQDTFIFSCLLSTQSQNALTAFPTCIRSFCPKGCQSVPCQLH